MVDDTSSGFAKVGDWHDIPIGYGSNAIFAPSVRGSVERQPWEVRPFDTPSVAVWQPQLPRAGRYRVLAYIPYYLNGLDDSQAVYYRVHHQQGETDVRMNNELQANGWADLGTYMFDPSAAPFVSLSTLAGDQGRSVWVDAVVWEPVE